MCAMHRIHSRITIYIGIVQECFVLAHFNTQKNNFSNVYYYLLNNLKNMTCVECASNANAGIYIYYLICVGSNNITNYRFWGVMCFCVFVCI